MKRILEWALGTVLRKQIDRRVADRTHDFTVEKNRIAAALRGASVQLYFQDRDLRYKSAFSPQPDSVGIDPPGRDDEELLPASERDCMIAAKKRVIATGEATDCEVTHVTSRGRASFALHIEPVRGADGSIEGISCLAVDITRMRALESDQSRLTAAVERTMRGYELALRHSAVTVFAQDQDLRYTLISRSIAGRPIEDIVGRTDADILTETGRDAVIALKQQVLLTGQSGNGEVYLQHDGGGSRWCDLHVEPLRGVTGGTVGLIGTCVDITKRKADEAHVQMLLRELTHRSKNLLAVIQAIARQTARHTTSVEGFVAQFDARLRALATSHDVLIEKSWHGASLFELAQHQLQPSVDFFDRQVSIQGPTVLLKPEAAQALGLALHELANNARKFGALSVPEGHLSLTWLRLPHPDGETVDINWVETGGPEIATPVVRRFGSMAIERNLERAIGGKVTLEFLNSGVRCDISIPSEHLVSFLDHKTA